MGKAEQGPSGQSKEKGANAQAVKTRKGGLGRV